MNSEAKTDPRWGQMDREEKAEAILGTLELHCGRSFRDVAWLDIGCGSGASAAVLASHVHSVVALDPEPWDRWKEFSESSANLRFEAGSFRDLPRIVGRSCIDVVVCNQVYEHVDDPPALLSVIYEVLRPGGVCYFAGPNMLWPIELHLHWPFAHWLPRSWVMSFIRRRKITWASRWDAQPWTFWRLANLFHRTGLRYETAIRSRLRSDVQRGNPGKFTRVASNLPAWVFLCLTPFAPGFVFVLSKPES